MGINQNAYMHAVYIFFRGLKQDISVCAASGYGIMMKEDGKLYSWGQNYRGDLGCGSEGYYAAPTEIKFGAK